MTTTTPHAQTAQPAVSARNLSKTYGMGEATVHALNNVSVDFEQGKFTAIMGPSGSGKSTLMQTIANPGYPPTRTRQPRFVSAVPSSSA